MSNLILPPKSANPAALLATAESIDHLRARQELATRHATAQQSAAETRRIRRLARLGLSPEDWPEYQRIMAAHGFTPLEAAGVVIRSRRP